MSETTKREAVTALTREARRCRNRAEREAARGCVFTAADLTELALANEREAARIRLSLIAMEA